jgi:hypothetical protein
VVGENQNQPLPALPDELCPSLFRYENEVE